MMHETVLYELNDEVALLRLNDPATLNSLSAVTVEQLQAALDRAVAEARAVVLTGAGKGFCSGANLCSGTSMKSRAERDMGAGLESHLNPLLLRLRALPVPFITAVNGAAAGVGCSLALIGDLIVAAQSAYFLQAFSRVALIPDGGSSYLLAAAIGRVRAMEMMLLGEKLPAAKALEWGLVNQVVPDGELLGTAIALAAKLADGSLRSVAATRQLAWQALEISFEEVLKLEREEQRIAGQQSDFEEGAAAFRERRPPRFKRKDA